MKTRNKIYDKSRLRLLCLLTALLGIFGAGQIWAQTQPSSGAGTQGDPYIITTADELRWFAGLVNGTLEDGTSQNTAAWATLTADIDLGGEAWTPIGNYSASTSLKYTGTFDGQGYTISNLTVDNSSSNYQGFVGRLGTNGTIQNLTLDESCSVSGYKYVGGVCGYNESTIKNCTNNGSVSGMNVGGVCGYNGEYCTLTNCTNTGTVTGSSYVGGVCGKNYYYGTVTYCTNSGKISSSNNYVGGICGYNYGTITYCINSEEVSSNTYYDAGGICGYNNSGTVTNCYNTGSVSGSSYVGGVCGENSSGTTTYCYNTGSVNSTSTSGAIVGNNNGTQATVSNCYYLTDTANGGINGSDAAGQAEVKTADAFASGEVAYLLQGSQTAQAWGQTLGTDDYPVLTTEEAKRIYAAKMYNGSANATDVYANTSGFSRPEGTNALCVIEDAASASTGTNIVVKNGEAYTCANLVLTDGADFYTPVAFTATQATYSRPLAEGTQWGTVALPFDATTVTGAELFRVASQEGNTLYVDETSGMADGEPLVFRANADVTTVDFKGTGVAVRATDAATTGSTSLVGTSQAVGALDAGAYFIYGDMFYRVAAGSQVSVKAFRAYIPATAGASTRSAGAASQLRIVFNASETTRAAHEGN